jgi:uncharacterized membrane protein YdjX (TVP38/TMEM64 family)
MRETARSVICGSIIALMIGWAVWSYETGGLVHVLAAVPPEGQSRLHVLREYVLAWGPLAPLAYIGTVAVEVVIAPIPGTLLYAPGGVIFGGLAGGALSLVGNVLGATLATYLARTFGAEWFARRHHSGRLARYRRRLAERGAWIIFLLRVNPLTSSDLVSYAAGVAGVSPARVALGTFFGMAPHCFLQAYLAASIFEALSPRVLVLLALAGAAAFVAVVLWRRRVAPAPAPAAAD